MLTLRLVVKLNQRNGMYWLAGDDEWTRGAMFVLYRLRPELARRLTQLLFDALADTWRQRDEDDTFGDREALGADIRRAFDEALGSGCEIEVAFERVSHDTKIRRWENQ